MAAFGQNSRLFVATSQSSCPSAEGFTFILLPIKDSSDQWLVLLVYVLVLCW